MSPSSAQFIVFSTFLLEIFLDQQQSSNGIELEL